MTRPGSSWERPFAALTMLVGTAVPALLAVPAAIGLGRFGLAGPARRAVAMMAVGAVLLGGASIRSMADLGVLAQAFLAVLIAGGLASLPLAVRRRVRLPVASALTLGVVGMGTLSLLQLVGPGFLQATSERAAGWLEHPNLWGAAVLVPTLVALELRAGPLRTVPTLLAAGTVILTSGSRTAAAAWLLVLVAYGIYTAYYGKRWRGRGRVLLMGLAVAALAVASLAWLSRPALFVRFVPALTPKCCNLLKASEDLGFPAWGKAQIRVEEVGLGPLAPRRAWRLVKTGDAWWARAQQGVRLEPGETYTYRFEWRSEEPSVVPGVHGSGRNETHYVHLNARHDQGGWSSEAGGAAIVVDTHSQKLNFGWSRLALTFRYEGEVPIRLQLGPTPDQRDGITRTTLLVRAPQLVREPYDGPYVPTFAGGQDARASFGTLRGRLTYAEAAWAGFREHPLFGRGRGTFMTYYESFPGRTNYLVRHAHNLVLQTLFEAGLVGLAGLLTFLVSAAILGRSTGILMVSAVVLANLTDLTFWSGHVFYGLAAACGWFAPTSDGGPA